MPHESKRIFIDNYYTPRLPEDPNMPSVTSNRLPGDYNVISPHHPQSHSQQQQQQQSLSSFPPIPEDIQTRLLHVGMRVRKNVAEGHRNAGGSIPSYQPNFGLHTIATFYGDSPQLQHQQQPVLATRMISAPAVFNTTPVPAGCSNRLHLKRGRDDDDEDDTDDDNNDDATMDMGNQHASTNATSTASFAGSSGSARRLGSESATKVFYVPASQQQQKSFTEDFEDATFLSARDSLN
jgi:hypothetical protein